MQVCPALGCPTLTTGGRCDIHARSADRRRGTARERGYRGAHVTRFRPAVLRRDPMCVCTDEAHGHGPACLIQSTVADHHPLSRRELVARGLDPNDPRHGRGLCKPCHDRHTSTAQPGGWNAR